MTSGSLISLFIENITYTSITFAIIVGILFVLYYLIPTNIRWSVLLFGSIAFYIMISGPDIKVLSVFLTSVVINYFLVLAIIRFKKRWMLLLAISITAMPLLLIKISDFANLSFGLIVPVGISFYTLQMVAYLCDVYSGKENAQRNFLKYLLFISYFPIILQGPIPRYSQLKEELFTGHKFDGKNLTIGLQTIFYGLFLKFVIADRAGIIVNTVFGNFDAYKGMYVLIAGILYSIQLYTDFYSCLLISMGVSRIFGISLPNNFMQPYLAVSVKDFWRRWHISLSTWLRDYIYIPLGGNRRGKVMKYINLLITFLVSGFWHGNGLSFIFWGLLHGIYQICGDIFSPITLKVLKDKTSKTTLLVSRVFTFFLVMLAWIIFRADSLKLGLKMILSIFSVNNLWILTDGKLLELGLDNKNWIVLIVAIVSFFCLEIYSQKNDIMEKLYAKSLLVRYFIYLFVIAVVAVFGIYGYGFEATDFIYRGF